MKKLVGKTWSKELPSLESREQKTAIAEVRRALAQRWRFGLYVGRAAESAGFNISSPPSEEELGWFLVTTYQRWAEDLAASAKGLKTPWLVTSVPLTHKERKGLARSVAVVAAANGLRFTAVRPIHRSYAVAVKEYNDFVRGDDDEKVAYPRVAYPSKRLFYAGNGGMVVLWKFNQEPVLSSSKMLRIATSWCSPNDNYDALIGKVKALAAWKNQGSTLFKLLFTGSDLPVSKQLWDFFYPIVANDFDGVVPSINEIGEG